ncbi:VOC family protein [Natrarchaeobius oligotrophus]|uniref:VOC family protein n=1 Tax=Natrarchaeobius chitinivorans TaxID=1679083 RepID=A0A3N6MX83_NATCH|nr:VOC family protein [Natrarchaeobius chitinivorans]RQH02621.1 VOC family protein [Natrarchaeobius chitinivorans]
MDVIHSAIWVSDIEETLSFYVDDLGLEKTREFVSGEGARNVYVAGDNGVELQLKHDPERGVPEPTGIDHIAIAVDDTDAEVERLVAETDCTLERGPLDSDGANARVAFLEGPDGYGIELVQEFE